MDDVVQQWKGRYHLSFQEGLQLERMEEDLALWEMGSLADHVDLSLVDKASSGQRGKLLLDQARRFVDAERKRPTDYSTFQSPRLLDRKPKAVFTAPETFMGRCPCPADGEQTRCCNLKTLDAVEQCSFGCAYCAVQTFYGKNEIRIVGNLKERLETLELDPGTWHIGTGQSSDSLLWGNDFGTLDALKVLARRYPDLIIELKTKSSRTDWISDDWPKNIVATWSLNAPLIIEKEELLTSSLKARLDAARIVADHHIPVGFHLHPMVYFQGWEQAYQEGVGQIMARFRPEEVMMVSMGTLTFTKSVIKALRKGGRPSRILDMELVPFAGKYSYPIETKQRIFKNAYHAFAPEWKEPDDRNPFFYLCFEDPKLWKPVMGYEYASNAEFEEAMRRHYLQTVRRFRQR